MTGMRIADLFERLSRLVAATKQNAGNGTSWQFTFPNRETHTYSIRGLKSYAEAEDSIGNLLIWIWSAKDYLKQRALALGGDGQLVEKFVDADSTLPICADLANRLKHGGLNRSRSGLYPILGKVSFNAPQAAIGKLVFGALEVEVQIADPSQVEFFFPVFDDKGNVIGDASEYAEKSVAALEILRDKIERQSPNNLTR